MSALPGPLRDPTAEYDRLGRKQPRLIPMWLRALERLVGDDIQIRRVPSSAVVQENFEDREAMVACPCGGRPTAMDNEALKCPGCDRYYIHLGGRVWVLYGPTMEPPAAGGSSAA